MYSFLKYSWSLSVLLSINVEEKSNPPFYFRVAILDLEQCSLRNSDLAKYLNPGVEECYLSSPIFYMVRPPLSSKISIPLLRNKNVVKIFRTKTQVELKTNHVCKLYAQRTNFKFIHFETSESLKTCQKAACSKVIILFTNPSANNPQSNPSDHET